MGSDENKDRKFLSNIFPNTSVIETKYISTIQIVQMIFLANVQLQRNRILINVFAAVMVILWARVSLALRHARFWMRNALGLVLISSLVCAICNQGGLRTVSGDTLNCGAQEKVVKTGWRAQDDRFGLNELLGQFIRYSTLKFFGNLSVIVFS